MTFLRVILIAAMLPLAGCAALQNMGMGGPRGDVEDLPEVYNVFFGFDSAALDDTAEAIAVQAAADATRFEPVSIQISGFSGPGPGETVAGIATQRLTAVEDALAAHGVDRALFERGELTADPNLPEPATRRVEIRFAFP